jgi:hypothetical protein
LSTVIHAIRFAPPLSVTDDEVEQAVTRFGQAVQAAAGGKTMRDRLGDLPPATDYWLRAHG